MGREVMTTHIKDAFFNGKKGILNKWREDID
jgi:hypothetical protein